MANTHTHTHPRTQQTSTLVWSMDRSESNPERAQAAAHEAQRRITVGCKPKNARKLTQALARYNGRTQERSLVDERLDRGEVIWENDTLVVVSK